MNELQQNDDAVDNCDLSLMASLLDNKRFELIVFPTEKCNFRCAYCYEDFNIGRMSEKTKDGLKKLLTRRIPELDFLDLSWFGGEPLIAFSTVMDIADHACKTIGEKNKSCGYRGSMTTNGYLLHRKIIEDLVSVGICDFQVSLDGPKEYHDETRITKSGRGTFKKIWQNLIAIKESRINVRITIRVHVTVKNIVVIEQFIKELITTFCDDIRFKIFLKPIEHLGGGKDVSFSVINDEQRTNLFEKIEILKSEHDLKSKQPEQAEKRIGSVCYAAKGNSLIIRADGSIAKCTVALRDPRNKIGVLTDDGRVLIDSSALRPWLRGIPNLDESILHCPLSDMKATCIY